MKDFFSAVKVCAVVMGLAAAVLPCVGAETAAVSNPPRIEYITPSIVRVSWSVDGENRDNATGVCVYSPSDVDVTVENKEGYRIYSSSQLVVAMDAQTGALTFKDGASGRVLLQEDPAMPRSGRREVREKIVYDDSSARMEDTANGKVTVKDIVRRDTIGESIRYRNNFDFAPDEGIYGLGSHMEGYMNLNGKTLYLTQHNLKVTVPVLVSTRGYGLLFDAGCAMLFESNSIEYDAANSLVYYFMKGEDMDGVVAQYRYLTGGVPMMPKYLFGYIQSKERYTSSSDIINTLAEYRRRHVPIDMIVQDWNYWPEGWGYMKMNPAYYPSPKNLADSVHAMNARLMVSIWPNPQGCPQERDFKEKGYMLGYSVYDAFNKDARKYYWDYADREFFSNGFDAWWCDSSEPLDGDWNQAPAPVDGKPYSWDDHRRRWELNKSILADCLGAERGNLYSLYHSMGIYENQRAATGSKRVVNLTRSGFAGQQRYSTIVWNGDTYASWESLKRQIPSGLNYMATGNPYWSVDVGAFFTGKDSRWFRTGDFPEGVNDEGYREFYTRMLQWGAFLPVLRSHGTDTPREIWRFGEPGTPYYDAILKMINLRYSMLPYIYSMAARQTFDNYTMARMLPFDFAHDANVRDIADEYMFGDILVCPVTDAGASSRRVYLPATADNAGWTDFWSGASYKGGEWIDAASPIDRLPLFVEGGSIIPTAEPAEYAAAQRGKPVTITVYPGADAEFSLYDDEEDGYGYEAGAYSVIPLSWNDKSRTLTIGGREGSYPGMDAVRKFVAKTPWGEREIEYSGSSIAISFE